MGFFPFTPSSGAALISVLQPSGDHTGASDAASIAAARAALPANGGAIGLAQGNWYLKPGTLANLMSGSVPVYLRGAGRGATVINAVSGATGDMIRIFNPTYAETAVPGGGITDITIDGTSASAGVTGLHLGDISAAEIGVEIRNFSGAGSIGAHFDNTVWWTEKLHGDLFLSNNATNVLFDVSGATTSTNSFGYGRLDIWINSAAGQDGLVANNGALLYHGHTAVRGNFASSSSAETNVVLRVEGTVPVGHPAAATPSAFAAQHMLVQVETDNANANNPATVNLANSATMLDNFGMLDFALGSGVFNPASFAVSQAADTFWFTGEMNGDTNLNPAATHFAPGGGALITAGAAMGQQSFASGSSGNVYTNNGDYFTFTLSASITVNLNPDGNTLAGPQRKTIVIHQAASGGPFTVTWPHNASPTTALPKVTWAGGTAPTMTATASAVDVYDLETLDGVTWYGRASQNVS